MFFTSDVNFGKTNNVANREIKYLLTNFYVCVRVKYDVAVTKVIDALKDTNEIVEDKNCVVILEKIDLVIITDVIL